MFTERKGSGRRQDVGSKTKQQCSDKVRVEVAAGRMQELGGKQERESWSQAELLKLMQAVDRHGRDWVSVSRDVGRNTNRQCEVKVNNEVAARRMQRPKGVPVSHYVGSKRTDSARRRLGAR